MEVVLREKPGKQERADVLAEEIERRGLYRKRRRPGKLEPRNVVLRALKHPEKFEIIVKLRDNTGQPQ